VNWCSEEPTVKGNKERARERLNPASDSVRTRRDHSEASWVGGERGF